MQDALHEAALLFRPGMAVATNLRTGGDLETLTCFLSAAFSVGHHLVEKHQWDSSWPIVFSEASRAGASVRACVPATRPLKAPCWVPGGDLGRPPPGLWTLQR